MADTLVRRFGRTSRCAHWANALGFLTLLVTGALLLFRRPLALGEGPIATLVTVHLVAAAIYVAGPATCWIVGDSTAWWRWVRDACQWRLDDARWLALSAARIFWRRIELPPQGRFNAGQRINMWAQAIFKLVFLLTGLALTRGRGQLTMVYAHLACVGIATVFLLGHLCMSVLNPSTRHSLRGIVTGWVSAEWARHHHALWVDSAEEISPDAHSAQTGQRGREGDESDG